MFACLAVCLIPPLVAGCASTNQMVPIVSVSGKIPANSARIIVSRENQSHSFAAPIGIKDSGKQIGTIGPGGQLIWDRVPGFMQLEAWNNLNPPELRRIDPLQICVGAGNIYHFNVSFSFSGRAVKIELVSGMPVACEPSGVGSIVKSEQGQQPSMPPTAAPTTSKTTEELQPFTGEIKIIEVRYFTAVEGMGFSREFINAFYISLRDRLIKDKAADQIIEEGAVVPEGLAANTIIIEGKFTEYKKGGFLEGVGMVGSEIKFYRKSDHALIKIITSRVPFKPSPLNTDSGVGKGTGVSTAREIRKALK